ncbi:hypothetical protein ACFL1R_04600 [Candidatus Latescibacterota bacterium]
MSYSLCHSMILLSIYQRHITTRFSGAGKFSILACEKQMKFENPPNYL